MSYGKVEKGEKGLDLPEGDGFGEGGGGQAQHPFQGGLDLDDADSQEGPPVVKTCLSRR